jgi:hypothetical protein
VDEPTCLKGKDVFHLMSNPVSMEARLDIILEKQWWRSERLSATQGVHCHQDTLKPFSLFDIFNRLNPDKRQLPTLSYLNRNIGDLS